MTIDSEILNCKAVDSLCEMYAAEYRSQPFVTMRDPVPSMLNALGACAGFAAQVAVWRELILPTQRNPGDFLFYTAPKSGGTFFFGDAINIFLFLTRPDRLSFLSLAAGPLSASSELPDIGELVTRIAGSVGTESFGQPRLPPSVDLPELPRAALTKTWGNAAILLREHRPAEWLALFGAAAYNMINANREFLAPPIAVRILLEAAAPTSKLDPTTVDQSGIPAPVLSNWSMRAVDPKNSDEILAEVRGVMPAMPSRISARSIERPKIAFLNLGGPSCAALATEDQAAIADLFHGNIHISSERVPICDVLFVYCAFEPSGAIVGQVSSLRDLIGRSRASVAVVASEVPSEFMPNISKSPTQGHNPPVNLVITNNRNGEAFSRFFRSLFQLMQTGVPMPMAWVQLAPQGRPTGPQDRNPGLICLMGAGQVTFGTRR
jgi:hypothetical protein